MNVVQLDVCSDEQVNRAVDYVKQNLPDSEKGDYVRPRARKCSGGWCLWSLVRVFQVCGLL